MFEQQLTDLLNRVLGEYVQNLDREALSVSVLKGDVVLKNLRLKPEALQQFKLPITVKAGLIGELRLQVQWRLLGKTAVVVKLDRVFLMVTPISKGGKMEENDLANEKTLLANLEAKLRRVNRLEQDWLDAIRKNRGMEQDAAKKPGSWMSRLLDTILGNLQFHLGSIHVRFEAKTGAPGTHKNLLALGVTLDKLTAITVNQNKNVASHANGLANHLLKRADLRRLALYFDAHAAPLAKGYNTHQQWNEMPSETLNALFEAGLAKLNKLGQETKAEHHAFCHIIQPVSGSLCYNRRGQEEEIVESEPHQSLVLELEAVSVQLSHAQLYSTFTLAEEMSAASQRAPYAHLRPRGRPAKGAQASAWWRYAAQTTIRKFHLMPMLMKDIVKVADQRRRYLALYKKQLLSKDTLSPEEENAMHEVEADLDDETILLFRCLSRVQLSKEKPAGANLFTEQQAPKSYSWFGSGWDITTKDAKESLMMEFSEDDLKKIREIFSMDQERLSDHVPGPHELLSKFEVKVAKVALRLVNAGQAQEVVLEGALEELEGSARLYPSTNEMRVQLASYKLDVPEGELLKSSSCNGAAMLLEYTTNPLPGVDAKVRYVAAPCLVTVIYKGLSRLNKWMKPPRRLEVGALQQRMAGDLRMDTMSTAMSAPMQIKTSAVRKVLHLHVEMHAPKLRLPVSLASVSGYRQLVLNFGRFDLKSEGSTRYELIVSSISASFCDRRFGWNELESMLGEEIDDEKATTARTLWPLLEPCQYTANIEVKQTEAAQREVSPGKAAQRAKVCLLLKLPKIAVHASPTRVRCLLAIYADLKVAMNLNDSTAGTSKRPVHPWDDPDYATWCEVLTRGPMRRTWQRQFVALKGDTIYVMEGPLAETSIRTFSVGKDRRVLQLEPSLVDNMLGVLAVTDIKVDKLQAVADSQSLVWRAMEDLDHYAQWLRHAKQANASQFNLNQYNAGAAVGLLAVALGPNEQSDANTTKVSVEALAEFCEVSLTLSGMKSPFYKTHPAGARRHPTVMDDAEDAVVRLLALHSAVILQASSHKTSVSVAMQGLVVEDLLRMHYQDAGLQHVLKSHHQAGTTAGAPRHAPSSAYYDTHSNTNSQSNRVNEGDDEEEFFDCREEEFFDCLDEDQLAFPWHVEQYGSAWSVMYEESSGPGTGEEWLPCSLLHTADGVSPDFLLQCTSWNPGSPAVRPAQNVILSIEFHTLHFTVNRRTLQSLLRLPADLLPASRECTTVPNTETTSSMGSIPNNASTGHDKCSTQQPLFLVSIKMQAVDFALHREDGHQMGLIAVEDITTKVSLYLLHIHVKASLGRLRLANNNVPEEHPYHWVMQNRAIAAHLLSTDMSNGHKDDQTRSEKDAAHSDIVKSWLAIEYTSYSPGYKAAGSQGKKYQGESAALVAKISELAIVYQDYFFKEMIAYFKQLFRPPENSCGRSLANPITRNTRSTIARAMRLLPPNRNGSCASAEDNASAGVAEDNRAGGAATLTPFILKMKVDFDAPVILMPASTLHIEALELNLGKFNLSNSFEWDGQPSPPTASSMCEATAITTTMLDTSHLDFEGLKVFVRDKHKNYSSNISPLIEGCKITMVRPLKDAAGTLPLIGMTVRISSISLLLNHTDYKLLTKTISLILRESHPNLKYAAVPPLSEIVHNLRGEGQSKVTFRLSLHITSMRARLEEKADLDLPKSLGDLEVTGLRLRVANTESQDLKLLLSIADIQAYDLRADKEGVKTPVIQADNPLRNSPAAWDGSWSPGATFHKDNNPMLPSTLSVQSASSNLNPTLLCLEYHWQPGSGLRPGESKVVVNLQQLRVVFDTHLLLAVVRFFVPTFVGGTKETMDEVLPRDLRFVNGPELKMHEDVKLSCTRRLVADTLPNTEMVYDGAYHTLTLPDLDDMVYMKQLGHGPDGVRTGQNHPPCVLVGSGVRLRFKNVRVVNSRFLLRLTRLGAGGSFSVDESDGVFLVDDDRNQQERALDCNGVNNCCGKFSFLDQDRATVAMPPMMPARMHVSVRLMGLTVLMQCHLDGEEDSNSVARDQGTFLQLTFALALEHEQQDEPQRNSLCAHLTGFSIMTFVGDSNLPTSHHRPLLPWPVLAPCDVLLKCGKHGESSASGLRRCISGHVEASAITLSLSPQVVTLLKQVIHQVTETMGGTSGSTIITRRFMLVHSECKDHITSSSDGFSSDQGVDGMGTGVAFWRPVPVAGYCSLGDLVTCGSSIKAPPQPIWSALMIRDSGALVMPPKAYKKVWRCEGDVSVWMPVPMKGFVAMGCIAHVGRDPPPLRISRCVREELVVPIIAESVLQTTSGAYLFTLANCASTFLACAPKLIHAFGATPSPCAPAYDLRLPLGLQIDAAAATSTRFSSLLPAQNVSAEENGSAEENVVSAYLRSELSGQQLPQLPRHAGMPLVKLMQLQTVEEDRVGTYSKPEILENVGLAKMSTRVTVWRSSNLLPGYASLGDMVVDGVEPPHCLYAVKADAEALTPPQDFEPVNVEHMCAANISFWRAVPPQGFVALGDVVWQGHDKPPLDLILCVRSDLVEAAKVDEPCVWSSNEDSSGTGNSTCSAWSLTHPLPNIHDEFSLRTLKVDASSCSISDKAASRLRSGVVWKGREQISPPPLSTETPIPLGLAKLTTRTVVKLVRMWRFQREGSVHAAIWRPEPPPGFFSLGDCAQKRSAPPVAAIAVAANAQLLALPQRFELVWRNSGSKGRIVSMWRAIPPPGFVALGDLVCVGHERPSFDAIRCVRQDLTTQAHSPPLRIWSKDDTSDPVSVWKIDERTGTFKVQAGCDAPDQTTILQLRKNDSAEDASAVQMAITGKLEDLSLRLHDDSSSTKAPVLGLSLQGVEGKVSGTNKAMRLTMRNLTPALHSFSIRHGQWEPVIEPFKMLLEVDVNKADNPEMSPAGTHVKVTGDGTLRLVHTLDFVNGIRVVNTGLVNALKGLSPARLESMDVKNGLGQPICMKQAPPNQDSEPTLPRAAPEFSQVQADERLTLHHTRIQSVPPLTNSPNSFRQTRLVSVFISHASNLTLPASALPRELAVRLSLNEGTKLKTSKFTDLWDGNKYSRKNALLGMRSVCSQDAGFVEEENGHAGQLKTWFASWRERFFMEMPCDERLTLEVVLVDLGPTGQPMGMPIASGIYQGMEVICERALQINLSISNPHGADHVPCGILHVCLAPVVNPEANNERMVTLKTLRVADRLLNQSQFHGPESTWIAIHQTGPWTDLSAHLKKHRLPGSRLPVVVKDAKGQEKMALVLQTKSHAEVLLRSPVQVHNATNFSVDVQITANDRQVDECFENQRYMPAHGFGYFKLAGDRSPFTDARGSNSRRSLPLEDAPEGWRWEGDWELDLNGNGNPEDGWSYALNFNHIKYPWPMGRGRARAGDFVRSRRWIRIRSKIDSSWRSSFAMDVQHLWTVEKEHAQPLPLALIKCGRAAAMELVVRPCMASRASGGAGSGGGGYDWSLPSAHDASRKRIIPSNLFNTVIPLTCRQHAQIVGRGTEPAENSGGGAKEGRQVTCHLVASVAKEILDHAWGDSLVDWSITVSTPLRIKNALPCKAWFVIYEKTSDGGNLVQRERGSHLSGEVAHIHSVDLQKPVYITWEMEGWSHKGEPVLLCSGSDRNGHLTGSESKLPQRLLLTHPTHKSLHVRLERTFLPPFAAPLILRVHVPLWLDNATPFSLAYFLTPLENKESTEAPAEEKEGFTHVAKVQHISPSTSTTLPSGVQERTVRGGENIMLSAEYGFANICLMVGDSGYSAELPISRIPTVIHAQQQDGKVLSVVVASKQGPKSMPFILVVEPLVRVYNWTGSGLQMCQPRGEVATREDLKRSTMKLPRDGRAVPWEWANPLIVATTTEKVKVDTTLRMSLKTDTSRWSPCISLPTTLCSEHRFIMPPSAARSSSKPASILHVFKRLVPGSQLLEIIFEHAKPSHVPYHIVNRTRAPLEVRQYAPGLNEDANPWTPLPATGAVPFAWGGNPKEDVEVRRVGATNIRNTPTRFTLEESMHTSTPMGVGVLMTPLSIHQPLSNTRSSQKMPLPMGLGGDALGSVEVDKSDPEGMHVKVLTIGHDTTTATNVLAEAADAKSELVVDVRLENIEVSAMDPANMKELILLSIDGLHVKIATFLGSGADSLLVVSMQQCQLDDLCPSSPRPIMLAHDPAQQPFLELLCTQVGSMDASIKIHPYIGMRMNAGSLQMKITESTLRRLVTAGQEWKDTLAWQVSPDVVVNADPTLIIQVMMLPYIHAFWWFNKEAGYLPPTGLLKKMPPVSIVRSQLNISPIIMRHNVLSQSLMVETVKQNLREQVESQQRHHVVGALFGALDSASFALSAAGHRIVNNSSNQQPDRQASQSASNVANILEKASVGIQGVSTTIKRVGQFFINDFVVNRRRPPRTIWPDGVLRVYDDRA